MRGAPAPAGGGDTDLWTPCTTGGSARLMHLWCVWEVGVLAGGKAPGLWMLCMEVAPVWLGSSVGDLMSLHHKQVGRLQAAGRHWWR